MYSRALVSLKLDVMVFIILKPHFETTQIPTVYDDADMNDNDNIK